MMYVVGYIICFKIGNSSFFAIALLGDMPENVKSWFDYTVCEHPCGDIALV
jgi:hypothetical protein